MIYPLHDWPPTSDILGNRSLSARTYFLNKLCPCLNVLKLLKVHVFYLLRHTAKFWRRNRSWKRDSDIMMTLDLVLLHYLVLAQMSRLMTKPTKWHVRPAKTQISLGIGPVWSDWTDAQADLSLRSAQRSVCWFCHEAAQILLSCSPPVTYSQGLVEELIILSASTHVDDSFVHKVRI